jgi:hypothetical protein
MSNESDPRMVAMLNVIDGPNSRRNEGMMRWRIEVYAEQNRRMWSIVSLCLQCGHSSVIDVLPFLQALRR